MGRAFTDVQELKQAYTSALRSKKWLTTIWFKKSPPEAAGGTSILHQTMRTFLPPTVCTCILVDLHGYDGWAALAALEALWHNFWIFVTQIGCETSTSWHILTLKPLLFSVQNIRSCFIAAKRSHSTLFTMLCPPRRVQKATKFFVAVCASTCWGMTSRSVSQTKSTMIAGLVHCKSQVFHNLMGCWNHWRKDALRQPVVATVCAHNSNRDSWSCRVWHPSLWMGRWPRMLQLK